MQANAISSAANEKLKRWKKLVENSRSVKKMGTTLAEGVHLAQVIEGSAAEVLSVIVRENGVSAETQALAARVCGHKRARLYCLADTLYDSVCPVEHGVGLMLEVQVPECARPAAPLAGDALYLDGVQDAGNAGTMIRTAVAAGVRLIVANEGTASLWSAKVLRAGMGAHFGAVLYENVPPEQLPDLLQARRLAADARGGVDLFASADWHRGATVWMMGSEGAGLSERALAVAQQRYLIPIEAACESLNVGAAAAVCLFEQRRRRLASL